MAEYPKKYSKTEKAKNESLRIEELKEFENAPALKPEDIDW